MDAVFNKPERQSRSCKEKGLISKLNCYQKANLTQVDVQFKSVLGTLQNWHCTSNTFHTLTPIFFIDTRAMTLELWSGKSFRKCGRPLNLWMCACFSQPRACGWITFLDYFFKSFKIGTLTSFQAYAIYVIALKRPSWTGLEGRAYYRRKVNHVFYKTK